MHLPEDITAAGGFNILGLSLIWDGAKGYVAPEIPTLKGYSQ